MTTITVPEAARTLEIAASSIRNYCKDDRFRPYFSAGATPATGTARQLSPTDVKLLAFISRNTAAGISLGDVAQRLADGELQAFEWTPDDQAQETQPGSALMLIRQYRIDLQEAHAAEVELLREVADLRARLAAAEAELTIRRRSLWDRLFRRPQGSP